MSDLFNNDTETKDLFLESSRNEDIDLTQFLKKSNTEEKETVAAPVKAVTVKPVEKKLTPLQLKMKEQETQGMGMPITKEQVEAHKEQPLRMPTDTEEREQDVIEKVDEMDETMRKRMAIVPLRPQTTEQEYIQMINEIDMVEFGPSGKAYFREVKDENGNTIVPTLIRLRTENDPPYSKENDLLIMQHDAENRERIAQGLEPLEGYPTPDPSADVEIDDGDEETEDAPKRPISDKAKKIVNFIIDKTGLGYNFELTDDEQKKISEAQEIRLTQVETLDIASINIAKPSRDSFVGKINGYQVTGEKTTICFPASGFKADMIGLSYGEIGDLSIDMSAVTVDKYYKRLAIVYNKMKNISSGPFKSFDEFLKNIAYTDLPLAIYGLYVSTFPEVQTIGLRCGRQTCRKSFDWTFGTRNILKLESASEVFLEKMGRLAGADPAEYDQIYAEATVRNSRIIKLPFSGYLCEVGIASAYEFLYNFIPLVDDDVFKQAFDNDINDIYRQNALLLTTVLSVYVPQGIDRTTGKQTYRKCEGYKDILEAIYEISPEEIKILVAYNNKITGDHTITFSLGDVKCPHCQNVTNDMEINIDSLVFQTYQRLLSTEINLENIPSF